MKSHVMELKPCPFCGGKVFFHHNVREMTGENQVECDECGVLVCFDVDMDEAQIEEAWNRRNTVQAEQVRFVLPWHRFLGDFSAGRFAWLLADSFQFRNSVPAQGRQGL